MISKVSCGSSIQPLTTCQGFPVATGSVIVELKVYTLQSEREGSGLILLHLEIQCFLALFFGKGLFYSVYV